MGYESFSTDPVDNASVPKPVANPFSLLDEGEGHGPWDISQVQSLDNYVDFGPVLIPIITGLEVSLLGAAGHEVPAILRLVLQTYEAQIMVFAAGNSAGLARESLDELCSQIVQSGGVANQCNGRWGREAHCQLPVAGLSANIDPMRVICVDGPRWMLRVTLRGAAAQTGLGPGPFDNLIDELIVRRGDSLVVPGDALIFSVPDTLEGA